jgi:uncharacterized protein
MSEPYNFQNRAAQARAGSAEMIDQGLRTYMLKVYNLMALGLLITDLASFST